MKSNKGNKLSSALFKSSSSRFQRHHKPAELFRTDFITAMKLPDTESLDDESYWLIKDPWKLDWEKGVQVPVKPEGLNIPNYVYVPDQYDTSDYQQLSSSCQNKTQQITSKKQHIVKLPKKYLCPANDKNYRPQIHEAYITHGLYTGDSIKDGLSSNLSICRYDCDQFDINWLNRVNLELEAMGVDKLTRINLERLIENFELQSHNNLKTAIEKLQSYSIEYDEDIVCDVCHSPDSEENNEMVFCDGCNMCVHQACYGIEKIPKGNWLCSPCTFGGAQFRPECVLCPNINGAMKATKNYRNWAHVSCALWIPETGFANPDKMEPIINLNQIPPSRWQLVCSLCKEKRGCCLQCSEKRCHAAFHVTCAFKSNLEMQTILNDNNQEDIEFKAYCLKHTKKRQLHQQRVGVLAEGEEDEEEEEEEEEEDEYENKKSTEDAIKESNIKPNLLNDSIDINQEKFLASLSRLSENDRKIEIIKQIQLLNYEFYKNVNLELTEKLLKINNQTHVNLVFNYWKLKRRFNASTISQANNQLMPAQNKPLMLHRNEQDLINRNERMLIAQVKLFINLRQDLERVRNLSYMVVKREKLKKQYFNLNQNLFNKQVEYMNRYVSQSNDLAGTPSNGNNRAGRLRDILQIKNENCIYDYPEYWLDNQKIKSTTVKDEDKKKLKVKRSKKVNKKNDVVNKIKSKYQLIEEKRLSLIKYRSKSLKDKYLKLKKDSNLKSKKSKRSQSKKSLLKTKRTSGTSGNRSMSSSSTNDIQSNSTVNTQYSIRSNLRSRNLTQKK